MNHWPQWTSQRDSFLLIIDLQKIDEDARKIISPPSLPRRPLPHGLSTLCTERSRRLCRSGAAGLTKGFRNSRGQKRCETFGGGGIKRQKSADGKSLDIEVERHLATTIDVK